VSGSSRRVGIPRADYRLTMCIAMP
jgi:hypothetical protein